AIRGAQSWYRVFRPSDQRSEAFVMALAGFAEQNGLDGTGGTQRLFDEAHTFDADEARFSGQAAAQREAKFLQPAIIAAGNGGGSAGGARRASYFARHGHINGSVANLPALALISPACPDANSRARANLEG